MEFVTAQQRRCRLPRQATPIELRALEWPASTCAVGRASSIELDEQGALTIGYSSGSTSGFTWSHDHFERTELGAVTP